ncbi:two-component sensor histidine kinase [Actinomadura barringtoniae]|uniref:histidine kinase n=1 Tax=Actinomadura barringtoniae TaxID=1427535 RepID=A0A939P9T8_9ACTN|nr:histidine kinase [Actinomadura barringtoniae]MBO2448797.1 two-component sensor histidine kinase [Actinomadura barringtoniae]
MCNLSRLRRLPGIRDRPGLDVFSDVVVVVLGVLLSVQTATQHRAMFRPLDGVTVTVLALVGASLVFRRRAPMTVAWLTTGLTVVLLVVEYVAPGTLLHTSGDISVEPLIWWPPTAPFAAYAVMSFDKGGRPPWVRGIPVVVLVVAVILTTRVMPDAVVQPIRGQETDASAALIYRSVLFPVVGALIGLYVSARRGVVRGLRDRAERAEREQHLLAEQARAEERARLAAEMHDVVAHRVTLMVLQAGALRVQAPDDGTRAAAEELRSTGCQALDELRDVIGLLRRTTEGPDEEAGAHGPLPDLSALIAESDSVGVPVELVEEGDPPLASPVVGRTAFRIVQEALTNVRKHAPGARVRVDVSYRTDGVRLAVRNTPPALPADADLAASGSGTGLVGLQQRVELIGGTFHSGPAPDGGFSVEASLPAYVPTSAPEKVPVNAVGPRSGQSEPSGEEVA